MTVSEGQKDNAQDSNVGLYKRIAKGLERQPAYLLVFAVSALFVLTGVLSSGAAIVQSNVGFGVIGLISFALALFAVVIVVREVERNSKTRALEEEHLTETRPRKETQSADEDLIHLVAELKDTLVEQGFLPDLIIGIARSGLSVAGFLSKQFGDKRIIPVISICRSSESRGFDNPFNHVESIRHAFESRRAEVIRILIVDEFCDSGRTLDDAREYVEQAIGSSDVQVETAALHVYRRHNYKTMPSFIVDRPEEERRSASGDLEPKKVETDGY